MGGGGLGVGGMVGRILIGDIFSMIHWSHLEIRQLLLNQIQFYSTALTQNKQFECTVQNSSGN